MVLPIFWCALLSVAASWVIDRFVVDVLLKGQRILDKMLGILFAFLFLICVFKFVGILLMMCGKVMGAVFSMLGFIISLAVGVLLFGLSAAFSMILLGIAAVWLLVRIIL